MSHLSDDDLVLLHYREPAGPALEAHAAGCAECAGRLRELGQALALAQPPEAPDRGEDYGDQVWERLRAELGPATSHARPAVFRKRLPRVVSLSALAAALLMAFALGRQFPEEPQPLSAEVRERVLLVAVGEHLERSQLVLVELVNAPPDAALNVRTQRALADELVFASRLYRQTAARSGDPALAALLEELERLLVEVAAGPDALEPFDLSVLQRRIESRGLLFKVRVVGSQVRERERQLVPRPATSL